MGERKVPVESAWRMKNKNTNICNINVKKVWQNEETNKNRDDLFSNGEDYCAFLGHHGRQMYQWFKKKA